jgi:Polyketide cyclase / dehydrase and lipid transport
MEGGGASLVVSKSAEIGAPADRIYGIIADYRNGHPGILPPAFTGLTVEAGGVGAGTRIRVGMRVFGRVMTFPAEVSEPYPGRVLVERNLGDRPSVTTFTVDRLDAARCRVTISTELPARRGLFGRVERFFTKRFLEPIYVAELAKLADVATGSEPRPNV